MGKLSSNNFIKLPWLLLYTIVTIVKFPRISLDNHPNPTSAPVENFLGSNIFICGYYRSNYGVNNIVVCM